MSTAFASSPDTLARVDRSRGLHDTCSCVKFQSGPICDWCGGVWRGSVQRLGLRNKFPCKIPRSRLTSRRRCTQCAVGTREGRILIRTCAPPSVITASIKPSKQTQLLLDEMSKTAASDEERWNAILEHMDLMSTRMNDMGIVQQELKSQV